MSLQSQQDPIAPPTPVADDDIRYAYRDGVATVTLNRPTVYNSYNTATLERLRQAFRTASFDDRVGVIVLTGAGDRAFCTGGDVKEYAARFTQRPHDYWKYMAIFQGAVESILDSGKPTIARLNGITVGGGNELHLACDLSIAAEHIYIGQVGVGVGSVACGGATQWLPLVVGDRRARSMLLTNERVPARRALEWGLVNEVAPSVMHNGKPVLDPTPDVLKSAQSGRNGHAIDLTALDDQVAALSARLLDKFPECLRYTREQTNYWKKQVWNATVGHAREWLALHFANLEPYEGMTAFTEKRPADVAGIRQRLATGGSSEFVHGPPRHTCPSCGAKGLPADFTHCGKCGGML